MSEEFEIGLFNHNATAYKEVKKQLKENNRSCIVHATGTGKSFIALQLMYDFLKNSPDKKVKFIFPINGIGNQLQEHIKKLDNIDKSVFKNVEFISYQSLLNKTKKELEQLDIDLIILDEFHHLGAPEWTSRIDTIINSHPNLKCFGMSATSVRERGTSREVDVAQTFFNGNIASEYDLADAISDGTLPAPDYHAAVISLEKECSDLEKKIKNNNLTPEEKQEYLKLLSKINKQISKIETKTMKQILKKYLKPDGKYIYFCPQGTSIKELQKNFLRMLPPQIINNIELYQVHSTEQSSKENNINHHNFYHNKNSKGHSTEGKLRVMFSVNMYNEGIHVPDIDGIIMGRNTNSEIIFYQQLGRALAVKKIKDGIKEEITPPLVIDFMNNFRHILKLYNKVSGQRKSITEKNSKTKEPYFDNILDNNNDFNFGLSEELIDILMELEKIKETKESNLNFEKKLEETYNYLQDTKTLPSSKNKEARFSDGTLIGVWLHNNKQKIYELSKIKNEAKAIVKYLEVNKNLSFEKKLEELYNYLKNTKTLPSKENKEAKFSDGVFIGNWICDNKQKIYELSKTKNKAKAIVEYLEANKNLSFEKKLEETYTYLQDTKTLPSSNNKKARFSDGVFIGQWIFNNKQKIYELSKTKNKAKAIVEYLEVNKNLSFEKKLEELYNYLKNTKTLPSSNNKEAKFSDGVFIGQWIFNNKQKIYELSKTKNKAQAIVEYLETNKNLSFEKKLEETYTYLQNQKALPPRENKKARFSDGVIIGKWIFSNKQKIHELSQNGNKTAQAIVEYLEKNKNLSFEKKLEETYNYLQDTKTLPFSNNKEARFSDGVFIGQWIFNNKQKIYELSQNGNKTAQTIVEYLETTKNLNFEEKLEEIYNTMQDTKILPSAANKEIKFSDGTLIGVWLNNNKQKIYKLYLQENSLATKVVQTILAIKPKYFDKIKTAIEAEEQFKKESRFEEIKKIIEETTPKNIDSKGEKENGIQI